MGFMSEHEIKGEVEFLLRLSDNDMAAFGALDGEDYGRGELEALKTEVARLSYTVTALTVLIAKAGVIKPADLQDILMKAQLITRS